MLYVDSLNIACELTEYKQNQIGAEMITITIVLVILLIKRLVSYILTITK